MTAAMVTPEAARSLVARKYERQYAAWATADACAAEGPLVDVPLRPPTEAAALQAPEEVSAWIAAWRGVDADATNGGSVAWEVRRWASMGTQVVPARLRLDGPEQVARFVRRLGHWRRASGRAALLRATLLASDDVVVAVRRTLGLVVELDADDTDRLVGVLAWLVDNPRSGMFGRQLPIRGVDSKWIERHRSMVSVLFAGATGAEDLGLAARPAQVRVRFLDEALAPGGIGDLSAPVDDLAQLRITPRHVVVVENLESLLSLPPLPGVVAIHGQGYAVRVLDRIPWVLAADVVYWGDLDTDGLNILGIARGKVAQTRSILMDRETLNAHLDLCIPDPKPRRTFADPLTAIEVDAVEALREYGDVRLEQERIPWETAVGALREALRTHPNSSPATARSVPSPARTARGVPTPT